MTATGQLTGMLHRLPTEAPWRAGPSFSLRLFDELTQKRLAYYPRATEALVFAEGHLPDVPPLRAVASYVGMTPAAFSRYFKAKINMTFAHALRTLRVTRALSELERRECAIEFLANHCGYSSGCSFTRAFKDVLGETPSEYRRRLLS